MLSKIKNIIRKISWKKTKAIISFSWWLDSLLAVKILEKQWIECMALTFETPFFSADSSRKQCKKYWIKLKVIDFSKDHFEIVKNPKNWHWKNMNPCIDCHWFMFKIALEVAEKEWYDLVASWEVIGQRPMSQNKDSLLKVKKIAWKDILRPLSALLMEETTYEKEWLVDRSKLLWISWRSRKEQLELTKEFWLTDFESAWGWCILTTIEYSNKLRKYVDIFWKEANYLDAIFLRLWREKFLSEKKIDWKEDSEKKFLAVMWRNKEDNQKIFDNFIKSNENYFMIKMKNFSWPVVILNTFWHHNSWVISEKIKDEISEWFKEKVKKVRDQIWDNKIELKIQQFKIPEKK